MPVGPNEQLPAPHDRCPDRRICRDPLAVALALLLAAPLAAQTLTNSFGGLTESSKDPIDIESDVLVVHDKQKYATFNGNVKAVQGTTTLRAKELNVHYVGGDNLATGAKKEGGDQTAPATKVADAQGGGGSGGNSRTPRLRRSRLRATSSSPARTTRPPRATGPSTTCRRNR